MTFEPTWSQPLENYQQTGSFFEPATPPAALPDEAPLVQLPCINEDWLPLVLGSLDQLRNPSSWLDSLTDSQRYDVLGNADRLRQMVAMAIDVPCCNVQIRLLPDCVLQYSVDGGVTWTDVAGWSDNFTTCVQGAIVPGVPLLPPGETVDQRACNISAFLAEELIQQAIQQAVADFNASKTLVSYITDILPIFAYAFPITTFGLEAFVFLYTFITSANIADFEAAATDPVLLELVKCAIYGAIRPPGYVTATNKAAICSAIGGITYTHPDVITAISGFCSRISLMQLQAMQNVGVYNDGIDCSTCGTWCWEWSQGAVADVFHAESIGSGSFQNPGPLGAGWYQQVGGSRYVLQLVGTMPAGTHITEVQIDVQDPNTQFDGAGNRSVYKETPCNVTVTEEVDSTVTGAVPVITTVIFLMDGTAPDCLKIYWNSHPDTATLGYVRNIRVYGTGTNPFGSSNC